MAFQSVAEIPVDPARATVFEHGWQSWSPTGTYPVTATSARPVRPAGRYQSYRPDTRAPSPRLPGRRVARRGHRAGRARHRSRRPPTSVPSVRAGLVDGHLVVSADGPVLHTVAQGTLSAALGQWADGVAAAVGRPALRPAPTVWCSWYHYFAAVTEADVRENLTAIDQAELPVDGVQLDDGWQAGIGDWLRLSSRFGSLEAVAGDIRAAGRRAGIWVAPFLVSAGSDLIREHPEWLIGGAAAGHYEHEELYGLDVTHPGAADYLQRVFTWLAGIGFDYFKIDFLYAGALPGPRNSGVPPLSAYRDGVRLIRSSIGPDAFLLGCGAPILPSVGLFDGMRVSADIHLTYEPADGDPARPSQRGAAMSTVGRAWQHGRFWVNDPDCLIVRPAVERRAEWARVVERYGGLRASSDRIGTSTAGGST